MLMKKWAVWISASPWVLLESGILNKDGDFIAWHFLANPGSLSLLHWTDGKKCFF